MARTKQTPKKKRDAQRYMIPVQGLKEIRKQQKDRKPAISKQAIIRLVREISDDQKVVLRLGRDKSSLRWEQLAIKILHDAVEAYATQLFDDCNVAAIHGNRVTIQKKDINLVLYLRRETSTYDTPAIHPYNKIRRAIQEKGIETTVPEGVPSTSTGDGWRSTGKVLFMETDDEDDDPDYKVRNKSNVAVDEREENNNTPAEYWKEGRLQKSKDKKTKKGKGKKSKEPEERESVKDKKSDRKSKEKEKGESVKQKKDRKLQEEVSSDKDTDIEAMEMRRKEEQKQRRLKKEETKKKLREIAEEERRMKEEKMRSELKKKQRVKEEGKKVMGGKEKDVSYEISDERTDEVNEPEYFYEIGPGEYIGYDPSIGEIIELSGPVTTFDVNEPETEREEQTESVTGEVTAEDTQSVTGEVTAEETGRVMDDRTEENTGLLVGEQTPKETTNDSTVRLDEGYFYQIRNGQFMGYYGGDMDILQISLPQNEVELSTSAHVEQVPASSDSYPARTTMDVHPALQLAAPADACFCEGIGVTTDPDHFDPTLPSGSPAIPDDNSAMQPDIQEKCDTETEAMFTDEEEEKDAQHQEMQDALTFVLGEQTEQ